VAGSVGENVRVGLEDDLYLGRGQMLTFNEQSILKIRRILEEMSRSIASPDETRAMLKLKGRAATNFG